MIEWPTLDDKQISKETIEMMKRIKRRENEEFNLQSEKDIEHYYEDKLQKFDTE